MRKVQSLCGISDEYPPEEIRSLMDKRGPEYDQMIKFVLKKLYFCVHLRDRIQAYLKVQSGWDEYLDDLWTQCIMLLTDKLLRGQHDGKNEIEGLLWRIFVNQWKALNRKLSKKSSLEKIEKASELQKEEFDPSYLDHVITQLSPKALEIFKRRSLNYSDQEIAEDLGIRTAQVRKIVYRARLKIMELKSVS